MVGDRVAQVLIENHWRIQSRLYVQWAPCRLRCCPGNLELMEKEQLPKKCVTNWVPTWRSLHTELADHPLGRYRRKPAVCQRVWCS